MAVMLPTAYVETDRFVKFNALRTAFAFPYLDEHDKVAEVIYDKQTKRACSIKVDYNQPFEGLKNDLDGGIPFWPVYASEGSSRKAYRRKQSCAYSSNTEISFRHA